MRAGEVNVPGPISQSARCPENFKALSLAKFYGVPPAPPVGKGELSTGSRAAEPQCRAKGSNNWHTTRLYENNLLNSEYGKFYEPNDQVSSITKW